MVMDKNLKASDLLKKYEDKRQLRIENYKVQYDKCLDSINNADKYCNQQYTLYTVPYNLPGSVDFDVNECTIYLKEQLRLAEFYVKILKPGNILLISWMAEHVKKVKKQNAKGKALVETINTSKAVFNQFNGKPFTGDNNRRHESTRRENETEHIIEFIPESPLSNIHLRAELMKKNPKYSHLKSVQSMYDYKASSQSQYNTTVSDKNRKKLKKK